MGTALHAHLIAGALFLALISGEDMARGQQQSAPSEAQPTISDAAALSSVEEGQTPLLESFKFGRERRLETRREAIKDTEFKFNLRTFYFDRHKQDGSESQAWTIGGWVGLKTGYFLEHISIGVTGYTSQKLVGDQDKDGSLLLARGQEGYTVLGEAFLDIRIIDDLNLFVGRKEFDSPYINRDDTRMTPNTFEAIVLQGKTKLAEEEMVRYWGGFFNKIKERNSDEFVSMAEVAGASVDRGVFTVGALYKNRTFSIGAIDYLSANVLNIGYAETTLEVPLGANLRPKISVQFTDQRSVGDNLQAGDFSAQQFGLKVDLPVEKALFTVGYTYTSNGANMQSPWSGYPGYTSVQVQEFNRAGEGAFLLRGGYEFAIVQGLSIYALGVFGMDPKGADQFRQNEYDFNIQWAPPEGVLNGMSVRVRYGLVQQFGGDADNIEDLRVIGNYAIKF